MSEKILEFAKFLWQSHTWNRFFLWFVTGLAIPFVWALAENRTDLMWAIVRSNVALIILGVSIALLGVGGIGGVLVKRVTRTQEILENHLRDEILRLNTIIEDLRTHIMAAEMRAAEATRRADELQHRLDNTLLQLRIRGIEHEHDVDRNRGV